MRGLQKVLLDRTTVAVYTIAVQDRGDLNSYKIRQALQNEGLTVVECELQERWQSDEYDEEEYY